jgi:hypothetical protein
MITKPINNQRFGAGEVLACIYIRFLLAKIICLLKVTSGGRKGKH